MSSLASPAAVANMDGWMADSLLPALANRGQGILRGDRSSKFWRRHSTSLDLDCIYARERALFLRVTQAIKSCKPCDNLQGPFQADLSGNQGTEQDDYDVASIPETEFETPAVRCSGPRTSPLRFLPLSPPADTASDRAHRQPSKHALPSSSQQRDVYDTAPPAGYKRLRKLHGGKPVVTPRIRSRTRSSTTTQQSLGDGFSGDEARPRTLARLGRDNRETSDGAAAKKRKRSSAASPILGTLDVVSLSQESKATGPAAEVPKAVPATTNMAGNGSNKRTAIITPLRPRPGSRPKPRPARIDFLWAQPTKATAPAVLSNDAHAEADDGDSSVIFVRGTSSLCEDGFTGESDCRPAAKANGDAGSISGLPPLRCIRV
ncbi:hypothetical protein SPI_04716 [Niveomyces insectorum RCEF 264]|uniref:Uncharacterized protein n=1 Tax=Niveomyces insectorum RCEF 264 TaxID=1081102 RepID=A0A167USF9_9HYPO|nr:hypothetical protein SPI_04716 [Niveomyces insectorum RCEF 264]